jgi:glycine cleavage system regulatory protein
MASLILTLVGPDRPGLVRALSEQVAGLGGSWLESRMAHLAGQFAGIVLVSLPDPQVAALSAVRSAPRDDGMRITLHETGGGPRPIDQQALALELVCQDRPGIIRDITRVLTASDVNIEELTTNILSGSFSGEQMFRAQAHLRLPTGLSGEALRERLEQLGNDMMVDLPLSAASA